jgi:hypothetical protein
LYADFYNRESAMKLSRILLSVVVLTACAAARSTPQRPWRIEVATSGGIAGHGVGTFAVDSDGVVRVQKPRTDKECTWTLGEEELGDLEVLLGTAMARSWSNSYVPKNSCCDRIHYSLSVDEAGDVRTTQWIDAPLPMPEDLRALTNAIVGGEGSLRVQSGERCK